jgi:hypothetical protein
MQDLVNIVYGYAKRIRNGRTFRDIYDHSVNELTDELEKEITAYEKGGLQGEDGINGEAVDVIACMLDLLVEANPGMSSEDLSAMVAKTLDEKCRKWAKHYSNSIHRDRSAG